VRGTTARHGRIEIRTLTTSILLNETCNWPGAQKGFKLVRQTTIDAHGQQRAAVAYGITKRWLIMTATKKRCAAACGLVTASRSF
jgi:hypothetical protein